MFLLKTLLNFIVSIIYELNFECHFYFRADMTFRAKDFLLLRVFKGNSERGILKKILSVIITFVKQLCICLHVYI